MHGLDGIVANDESSSPPPPSVELPPRPPSIDRSQAVVESSTARGATGEGSSASEDGRGGGDDAGCLHPDPAVRLGPVRGSRSIECSANRISRLDILEIVPVLGTSIDLGHLLVLPPGVVRSTAAARLTIATPPRRWRRRRNVSSRRSSRRGAVPPRVRPWPTPLVLPPIVVVATFGLWRGWGVLGVWRIVVIIRNQMILVDFGCCVDWAMHDSPSITWVWVRIAGSRQ